jgi:MFS family permease
MTISPYYLIPPLPKELEGLADVGLDLRWSWSHSAVPLWESIEPEVWTLTRNPWRILMAFSTALLSEAATTEQLIWIRVLQGIGVAGIAAPTFALAGDLARVGGEGRQMRIVTMGFGLGIALGPLIAGLLAVSSIRLPFFFVGFLLLVSAWIIHEKVPETVPPPSGRPRPELH